jgi:hypothetical protein
LRLDRGCERRSGAFAGKRKSGEICGFWQTETKAERLGRRPEFET